MPLLLKWYYVIKTTNSEQYFLLKKTLLSLVEKYFTTKSF